MRVRKIDLRLLKPHPLAHLIPDMRGSEWGDFYADIAMRGIKVPLEILADGTVVDGRHRLRAAIELGMKEVPVVDAPLNGDTPEAYMLKAAVLRRHLTDDQRATLAALWKEENKQNPQIQPRDTVGKFQPSSRYQDGGPEDHPTRTEALELFKVSKWKVDQASRLLHTAPDKFEEVHRGDMKLNKAYREIGNKNLEKREREIESPEGLYGIVYADPPWQYEFSATDSRSIEAHYPTMTLEEICNLKVPVKEDAILFLWVTMPKLPEGLKVIDSWGFEYKTGMAWIKDKIGMGYYVRNKHELLLIAKKGSPRVPEPENRPESVFFAPRNNHSEKPDIAYEIIEKMFPNENKIELFARKRRDGWESWGNEVS